MNKNPLKELLGVCGYKDNNLDDNFKVIEIVKGEEYVIKTDITTELGIDVVYRKNTFTIEYKSKLEINNSNGFDGWNLDILNIIRVIANLNNNIMNNILNKEDIVNTLVKAI